MAINLHLVIGVLELHGALQRLLAIHLDLPFNGLGICGIRRSSRRRGAVGVRIVWPGAGNELGPTTLALRLSFTSALGAEVSSTSMGVEVSAVASAASASRMHFILAAS